MKNRTLKLNVIIITIFTTVNLFAGTVKLRQELDLQGNSIINLGKPTAFHHAVPKSYADEVMGIPWKTAKADPDIVFQPVGIAADIDTLEWNLQSASISLQYTPFYCAETSITAAQYCRFLNAYKDKFANKSEPSCVVTSVFNEAQGGAWVDVQAAYQFCITRDEPITAYSNTFSKIKWDEGNGNYEFNVNSTETNEPMSEVSWYGAVAYCQWLNDVEFGSDTTKWKYRLPTQFEYQFMMGAKTVASSSDGIQDWGSASWKYGNSSDSLNKTANSTIYVDYDDTLIGTVIVGNKGGPGQNSKNEFGCYEISGNVSSWCLDWSLGSGVSGKNYVYKTKLINSRAIRGGYWWSDAYYCRSFFIISQSPTTLEMGYGFRVVRSR